MVGSMDADAKPTNQVHIVRVSLVKPVKPTKRHSMYMSMTDCVVQNLPPHRLIFFYKTDKDLTHVVEALRQALARVLVSFYPAAGRLVEEGNCSAIDCNDQGVELIEARCNIPFGELERENFQIRPLFQQLAPMDKDTSDTLDAALVSFQVTTFVGGLTLGIASSHAIADGSSTWTFIRAVAEACRGETLTVFPLHARTLLRPEVLRLGASFPNMQSNTAPYTGSGSEAFQEPSNLDPKLLQYKIIHFSPEMLETLKQACISSNDHAQYAEAAQKPRSYVSTYQALGAYLWKRLTMAQGLDDEAYTELQVFIDARVNMIPPLTPAYFGNAIVGIPTPAIAGELTRETLGATAARIQQSIRRGDDAYLKKAIIAHEKIDQRKLMFSSMKLMLILNGSSNPVYKTGDFGWGEPEAVRPPGEWIEGVCSWYPGKKPKSIDVIVSLTSATSDNFLSPHLYPNDPLSLSAFPFSHVP